MPAGPRSPTKKKLLLRAMREKEAQLQVVYAGRADELWAEVQPWLGEQAWPPEDDLVETSMPAPRRARGG